MSAPAWTKGAAGVAGALFILGGVFSEPRDPASAVGLYTIGCILLGVAVALGIIDWWRDRP